MLFMKIDQKISKILNIWFSRKLTENLSILMVKSVQIRIDRLGKLVTVVHRY